MNPDLTDHESRIKHRTSCMACYASRITHYVARLEFLLILLISPLLIFPRSNVTPWLMAVVPLLWLCRWMARGRLTVRTPLDVPILGLLSMTAISLGATFDVAVSFSKMCRVFLGVGLFYAMVNGVRTERETWLAAAMLLAGGIAIAGISLVGTRWGSGKIPVLIPFLDPLYHRLPVFLQGVPRAQQGFGANQVGGTMALFVPLATALLLRHLASGGRRPVNYLPESEPEVIRQAGWNGALADVPGDYLMVVDANLDFNKVNPHITESLSYTVDLQDAAQPKAALTLLHQHEGPLIGAPCRHESRYDLTYEQMMQRCYWHYVRVYFPDGCRLQTATPHPVPGSVLLRGKEWAGEAEILGAELNKAVFATFLVLAPQERIETRFVYDLPPGVVEQRGDLWRYQLYVQKQGGTEGNELMMALNLPVGAEVIAASPPPAKRNGDTLLYELQLYSDVELYVEWEGEGR